MRRMKYLTLFVGLYLVCECPAIPADNAENTGQQNIDTEKVAGRISSDVIVQIPGTVFNTQCRIPAGAITTPVGEIQVREFYMDENEITIGQYEQFIDATRGQKIQVLLPPGWTGSKADFVPREWHGILSSINNQSYYERVGERLTRDHPIFNIDYADAYAYAKWVGKRLPTEAEWQRAAAGNENYRFPWGNEVERQFTNTGVDMNTDVKRNIDAASVDGFRGPSKVNQFARNIKDISPFGVRYLGGNVSEWVETSPDIAANTKDGKNYIRGGNFNVTALVPNQNRIPMNPETRQPFLGFRCVSDSPMGQVLGAP